MAQYLSSGTVHHDTVKAAFEALRRSQSIADSPLIRLVLVRQHAHQWHGLIDFSQALFDVLINLLTTEFNHLRHLYHWDPVSPDNDHHLAQTDLALMGTSHNQRLIMCSAFYYRYVRADLALRWSDLASALCYDERNLRRHRANFWDHLCNLLMQAEHQAQQMHKQMQCQLALPKRLLINLSEQEQQAMSLARRWMQCDFPPLLIYGPRGIGKSVLAMKVVTDHIERHQVDHVVWLDVGLNTNDDNLTSREYLTWRVCQQLGLPVHTDQSYEDTLHTYLLCCKMQHDNIYVILDDASHCDQAIKQLWSILSHCRLILTTQRRFANWQGMEHACSSLSEQSIKHLIRFWDEERYRCEPWLDRDAIHAKLAALAPGNVGRVRHGYRLWYNLHQDNPAN